ncbi:hypothetical protein NQ176_g9378 [Zarea fungicola]|uniref:Uncharacterized protein n=1 Tax=Zarea fungicola TaxID=93591 RepID=A0ACC1MMY8_9HYPO|nr:hypothetical protein NQ176_g9378 [Lecanicillium fungicola]
MFDHVALSVPKDKFPAVVDFYAAALAPLGYDQLISMFEGQLVALGDKTSPMDNKADFWLSGMSDTAVEKNYAHWAFVANERDKVDAFYAKALETGGKDNGPPGLRPNFGPNYYAAFVIDPMASLNVALENTQTLGTGTTSSRATRHDFLRDVLGQANKNRGLNIIPAAACSQDCYRMPLIHIFIMEKSKLNTEYDIVFAGGGAAACVAAGRLAAADPSLSILLIERGDSNLGDVSIVTPAMCWGHLLPGSKHTLIHKSNKEEAVGGREVIVQTGGVLGGGSSINVLMYTRGSAVDYDSWNTEGWDGKTLMKLANKAENHLINDDGIDQEAHGHDGPVQITHGTYAPSIDYDDTFAGAEAAGVPRLPEVQDFNSGHGMTSWAKYIGANVWQLPEPTYTGQLERLESPL